MAWSPMRSATVLSSHWAAALDAHVFHDSAGVTGRTALALGDVHSATGAEMFNSSLLFWLLICPDARQGSGWPEAASTADFQAALERVEEAVAGLGGARLETTDATQVTDELAFVADGLRFACRLGAERQRLGFERSVADIGPTARRALAGDLRELIERHRTLWRGRSREGGLDDSASRLERTLAELDG